MGNGRGSEQAPKAIRRNGRACLGLGPWNRSGSWPRAREASRNHQVALRGRCLCPATSAAFRVWFSRRWNPA
jgi:hypothetical protein